MSPEQGRRPTEGEGGAGSAGNARARRLGLAAFGVVFVALFAIVAISEGLGSPSVPDGDVALVEEAGGSGEIGKAEFDRALAQSAAQAGINKTPKPGDPQYDELKESALNTLFEYVWLEGLAEEMGLSVTDREIQKELEKVKDESFQTEAEYKKFLKEANFTQEDVDRQVKLQKLSTEIQEELQSEAPEPSEAEIESYYEAARASQFTQPPSRSVRLLVNEDRAKAKQAKAALGKSNTAQSWEKVAKKYSEDATTKENGGLQEGITEGALEEPLDEAVFGAPEGVVEGPIKTQRGYYVFEVQNSSPEETQELKAVEAQIESQLKQQAETEYFNSFVSDFNVLWSSRTFCADGFVTERCANYEGDGHPATAPPACYEADPDGGRPPACPAPVFQLVPAQPGSISPLQPQGTPLAQRPRPAPGEEGGAEATTGPEGETVPPPPAE